VELKLGRSMWHMVDQGNAVARLSARSARRRGLGIARRGVEARPLGVARGRPGERGRSLSAGGVLDVEASGSLGVELGLDRSTCLRGRPGKRGRSLSAGGVLDVEASGSLGVELGLGRSTCPRGRPGKRGRSLSAAECSTSRPRDHSAWSWDSAARRVPVVDQGNAVAYCPRRSARRRGLGIARRGVEARPLDVAMVDQGNVVAHCPPAECSTSRPGDHSTWS
jgi:hypothetical protein